jgi:hypothetical protein
MQVGNILKDIQICLDPPYKIFFSSSSLLIIHKLQFTNSHKLFTIEPVASVASSQWWIRYIRACLVDERFALAISIARR